MWNRYSCTYICSSSVSSNCEHCNQREMDKMKAKQNSMNLFLYVCALEYFSMCTIIHGLNVWNYLSSLVPIIHYWQNAKCTVTIFLETLSWIFASLSASRPLITGNCLLNCHRLMDKSIEARARARARTHPHTHTRARTHTHTHTHPHTHAHTCARAHTHTPHRERERERKYKLFIFREKLSKLSIGLLSHIYHK